MTSAVIGYATSGSLTHPFVECVRAAQDANAGLIEGVISAAGPYIPQNRNEVVRRFLKEASSEWLWFLDTDIIFSPETLPWMLEAGREKGPSVIAALYFVNLKGGLRPTWLREDWSPVEYFSDKLEPIAYCGMGATLIHRFALEAMQNLVEPHDPWKWFGHDLLEGAHGWERMSEDYTFCHRVRTAGFDIWGIPVGCGHLKNIIVDFDTYMKERGRDGIQ